MDRSRQPRPPRLLVADEDQTTCTLPAGQPDRRRLPRRHRHDQQRTPWRTCVHAAPDLILADVNGNTLALVDQRAQRRAAGCAPRAPDTPVIALTSHGDEVHRVRLLERGSDDVIAKPFSYPELRARDRRRAAAHGAAPATAASSPPARCASTCATAAVTVDERAVELRGLEYRLLCHLAGEPTRVFTREELHARRLGIQSAGRTRTLDSHACRLRVKLS